MNLALEIWPEISLVLKLKFPQNVKSNGAGVQGTGSPKMAQHARVARAACVVEGQCAHRKSGRLVPSSGGADGGAL